MIFMSANTGIDEYASFLAETGEPALEKPFNLTDMRQVVMQVLSQVRSGPGREPGRQREPRRARRGLPGTR